MPLPPRSSEGHAPPERRGRWQLHTGEVIAGSTSRAGPRIVLGCRARRRSLPAHDEMNVHVYRVTVRGRFDRLSQGQSRILAHHAASHDVIAAASTPGGRSSMTRPPVRSASDTRSESKRTTERWPTQQRRPGARVGRIVSGGGPSAPQAPPGVGGEHGPMSGPTQPRRSPLLGWRVVDVAVAICRRCETRICPGPADIPCACCPWRA